MINVPLVLVHGLWDSPRLFHRLLDVIDQPDLIFHAPHLNHGIGIVPLRELAQRLDQNIRYRFGKDIPIDLLGFSMGGVISRIWLQEMQGFDRTRRFFSVGSPQKGTITACLVPRILLPTIADMKLGSNLLRELDNKSDLLKNVYCFSYYCRWDLMVSPGCCAVLPYGVRREMPVFAHHHLISDRVALEIIKSDLLGKGIN